MKKIDAIQGIRIDLEDEEERQLAELVDSTSKAAEAVVEALAAAPARRASLRLASSAALQSVNSLLASGSVQCHLSHPPEDIELVLNSAGTLVYRCYHKTPHEWDLTGKQLP